jgi:hypothetical protein
MKGLTAMNEILEALREAEEKIGTSQGIIRARESYGLSTPRPEDRKRLETLAWDFHKFLLDIQTHAIEDRQV